VFRILRSFAALRPSSRSTAHGAPPAQDDGPGLNPKSQIQNPKSKINLTALACVLATACMTGSSSRRPIPADWSSVPSAPRFEALSYDPTGLLLFVPRPQQSGAVRIVTAATGEKLVRGSRDVTPEFAAIDSFDFSSERGEVAFSAQRGTGFDTGFDIALVSSEGGDVKWMPNDPADEVDVQWAPRGHKVSYVIRGRSGDVVRTLHIPTAAQLVAGFPYARVRALAWEPRGERYAVAYETPDASQRVEVMTYGGSERSLTVPPAVATGAEIEPGPEGSIVLRPESLRYGEKLPVVVWVSSDPLAWNDARGMMLRNARVGCVITRVASQTLWRSLAGIPWLDLQRSFVVGTASAGPGVTLIRGSDEVASGTYLEQGRVLTVPAAVVESFAARYIAERLNPQHGRK